MFCVFKKSVAIIGLQSCQRKSHKIVFFSPFFCEYFLLVCRMVTIFLLTQRTRLGGPIRYLEHVRQANRKEEQPNFGFRSLFDRSHFLLLILLIFREKVGFGSKFRVASVYILLESHLENNQPAKSKNSKYSKYANFS